MTQGNYTYFILIFIFLYDAPCTRTYHINLRFTILSAKGACIRLLYVSLLKYSPVVFVNLEKKQDIKVIQSIPNRHENRLMGMNVQYLYRFIR